MSIFDEMPPGRTTVETRVLTIAERERAYSSHTVQIAAGRQAFIIYTLVEGVREDRELGALSTISERLMYKVFPKQRVGLLPRGMTHAERTSLNVGVCCRRDSTSSPRRRWSMW